MIRDAMRFCLLTTFYPPYHFGGDGVYVRRLAQALGEAGHVVDVIHSPDAYHLAHPGQPAVQYEELPNVTRHELRRRPARLSSLLVHQTGLPAGYTSQIRAVLKPGRHDVVHFHNVSLLGAPGIFAMGDGVKLMTSHEYWLICPTHVLFRYNREACTERTCLRCTLRAKRPPQLWRQHGVVKRGADQLDAFIMSSRFAADRHREQGIDVPMEIIPPFVPIPDLNAVGPQTVGGPPGQGGTAVADDRPYFLYVGRLERLKGPQEAVEIFRGLEDVADLLLVGEGALRDDLLHRTKAMPHVRLLGGVRQDQLTSLYRHACGVIVPSLCYETFGLTAAEALAHGTPAIVHSHGALAEMIQQTGGGLGFTTHDEARDAVRRLAMHPELRETLGRRGRSYAELEWDRGVHLDRYMRLIDRLRVRRGGVSATHVAAAAAGV
jgi:glycosyltransferase involved in cell wall biosynthesis